MNSAIIWISIGSNFRIHDTRGGSMGGLPSYTTMREERRRRSFSGCPWQGAGGSIGRERIAACDLFMYGSGDGTTTGHIARK
jgi:hypothetical protein